MARIEGVERGGLLVRLAYRVAQRRYGQVLEPMTLWAHSPRLLLSQAGFESGVERWKALDPVLRDLAVLRAAQVIGCSWCLDFGTYLARKGGADEQQLHALAGWRESDLFTPVQRLALEYAEAASVTPVAVTDELVAGLAGHLTPAALVELAMVVAVENQRSRFNGGMGLTTQGFCAVPA
ncbi:MAG: carboxymuconolactone decarboxylase [Frankiales bacterium]|nr:carboxymuconolactone decarboxylase [Frankiales bacterium]